MKKIFVFVGIIALTLSVSFAQNKKADKEAAAKALADKAVVAIEAKDFVIIVDSYEGSDRNTATNTDVANFLSVEKEFVFLQGMIVAGNSYTNKLDISNFTNVADKKGNTKIEMQVKGTYITAKIEIYMKKGGNYADVIISPSKGDAKRFSGEVVPRGESKYFKRPGVV